MRFLRLAGIIQMELKWIYFGGSHCMQITCLVLRTLTIETEGDAQRWTRSMDRLYHCQRCKYAKALQDVKAVDKVHIVSKEIIRGRRFNWQRGIKTIDDHRKSLITRGSRKSCWLFSISITNSRNWDPAVQIFFCKIPCFAYCGNDRPKLALIQTCRVLLEEDALRKDVTA